MRRLKARNVLVNSQCVDVTAGYLQHSLLYLSDFTNRSIFATLKGTAEGNLGEDRVNETLREKKGGGSRKLWRVVNWPTQ